MARFQRPKDGEWVQPKRRGYKLGCCDCGLVHTLDFRVHAGRPQFRASRNERSTALMRRWRKKAVQPVVIDGLDPGIAKAVTLLRKNGLNTTDSGDGVSKPRSHRTIHVPHVHVVCEAFEIVGVSKRMAKLLGPAWAIEAAYSPADGVTIVTALKEPSNG
jgi:hypothetical protein